MLTLLETRHFTFADLQAKAFGDNSQIRKEIRDKYPDKKIMFQSSSNFMKNEHILKVYESKYFRSTI